MHFWSLSEVHFSLFTNFPYLRDSSLSYTIGCVLWPKGTSNNAHVVLVFFPLIFVSFVAYVFLPFDFINSLCGFHGGSIFPAKGSFFSWQLVLPLVFFLSSMVFLMTVFLGVQSKHPFLD